MSQRAKAHGKFRSVRSFVKAYCSVRHNFTVAYIQFSPGEALLLSYPAFTENIIAKFVNASTVDGYNPYRITKDGIEDRTVALRRD